MEQIAHCGRGRGGQRPIAMAPCDVKVSRATVKVAQDGMPQIGVSQPHWRRKGLHHGEPGLGTLPLGTATAGFRVCRGDGSMRSNMA